jgi:head-tail adaptor
MRRAPIHLYDKTMTVLRSTTTQDTTGGPSKSFANHLTSVPCRWQQSGGSEDVVHGRESTRKQWLIHCEGGQDIQAKDRCQATFRLGGVNTTVEVDILETREGQSAGITMQVIGEEVK